MMNRIQNSLDTLRRQLRWMPLRVATYVTLACLWLAFLGSSGLATISWADEPTTVSIDPVSQEVLLEEPATTDVLVENVTDLYGFELQITFDPRLVEAVQVQPGDFLSPDWLLENTVDNDIGTVDFALCQMSPSEPQSGDGILATITWQGKVLATSPITFTYANLSAPGGVPIDAATQDGEIVVTSEAGPSGLFGDMDGDCDVDMVDIMLVASRWRTSCENPDPDNDPSSPNYDALCDVNDDCVINIEDIMQVAAHWGDTC